MVETIKLSEMKAGDKGYLPSEGECVELRQDNGRLYLSPVEWEDTEPPTIIADIELQK